MRCISSALTLFSAVFFACVLSFSTSVKGDTITVTNGTQNTLTGVYTYQVQLSSTANVGAGNGFVIYDFPAVMLSGTSFSWNAASAAALTLAGDSSSTFTPQISLLGNYVSGTAPLPGGTVASAGTSPFTPNTLDNNLTGGLGTDNPNVDNLSFTYSGNQLLGSYFLSHDAALLAGTGGLLTGTITVQTAIAGSGATTSSATYVSLDNGGGILNNNVITVANPGGSFGNSPVPLPATFAGGATLFAMLGIVAVAKKMSSLKQA
jgi:hypothetical protein